MRAEAQATWDDLLEAIPEQLARARSHESSDDFRTAGAAEALHAAR